MNLKELTQQSLEIKELYSRFEKDQYGREWGTEEIYTALVSDIGDLGRLVLAEEGVEHITSLEKRLKHEIGECLWGISIIAAKYNIDLEESFVAQVENVKTITSK